MEFLRAFGAVHWRLSVWLGLRNRPFLVREIWLDRVLGLASLPLRVSTFSQSETWNLMVFSILWLCLCSKMLRSLVWEKRLGFVAGSVHWISCALQSAHRDLLVVSVSKTHLHV